jgi:hypothetical protein
LPVTLPESWAAIEPCLRNDVSMDVVRLGAWCDCRTEDEYRASLAPIGLTAEHLDEALGHFRRSASISVSEFAVLADGRRVTLHAERGFTTSASWTDDAWDGMTREQVESNVLATVLPDEDTTDEDTTGEEHPWEWLAELLGAHGIEVEPDALRHVPYDVELSPRLLARLDAGASREGPG